MMMMMMMIISYCGMVDWWEVSSLIFVRSHGQRFSSLPIFNTQRSGFDHTKNLSSDFSGESCAAVKEISSTESLGLRRRKWSEELPGRVGMY